MHIKLRNKRDSNRGGQREKERERERGERDGGSEIERTNFPANQEQRKSQEKLKTGTQFWQGPREMANVGQLLRYPLFTHTQTHTLKHTHTHTHIRL